MNIDFDPEDEWKPRSRGFRGRKRYGIESILKPEHVERRRQWNPNYPSQQWHVSSWYDTLEDREKALLVLQRKDAIFDYRRIDR